MISANKHLLKAIHQDILDDSGIDDREKFWELSYFFDEHNLVYLYDALHATGITTYNKAAKVLNDFIKYDTDGAKIAKLVEESINKANPNLDYMTNSDYDFGFSNTPTQMQVVENDDYIYAIQFALSKLNGHNYLKNSKEYVKSIK